MTTRDQLIHEAATKELDAEVWRDRLTKWRKLINQPSVDQAKAYYKIFKALLGTTCSLKWREATDKERLWNINPAHPITQGIGEYFEIQQEEMYGEPFGIPEPDQLLFISWFTGGEVFRSGATWQRGNGRIFYFRPGHETYPTYHHKQVQQVITNAVRWVRATVCIPDNCPNAKPLEPLPADTEAAARPTVGHK